MGCLAVFKFKPSISPTNLQNSCCRIITRVPDFGFRTRIHYQINYYHHENTSSSSSMDNEHNPPQEAILKDISAARGFTAIASGDDDFVQFMVVAVESVIQHPIPQGKVKQKLSSGGKYVSVNIGPVQFFSSKQVQAVYYAMKRDVRMRYFL